MRKRDDVADAIRASGDALRTIRDDAKLAARLEVNINTVMRYRRALGKLYRSGRRPLTLADRPFALRRIHLNSATHRMVCEAMGSTPHQVEGDYLVGDDPVLRPDQPDDWRALQVAAGASMGGYTWQRSSRHG